MIQKESLRLIKTYVIYIFTTVHNIYSGRAMCLFIIIIS